MFIIYQRQGFVSGQNPQGVTIQNRENLSIHNAKKEKKLVTRFHIFVHFDNQLLWKESFPMNVERTMRLGDPAKGSSTNGLLFTQTK